MATYLIDYENVKSEGIKGIAQLSEEDRVVIFYSHNADTITFEAMDMIFNSKAQVSKYKILCGGKNALDFQLSTYLGYLIHEAKDSYFYIISKDNGFKHVVDFWKRTFRFDGYVYCFATIADGNARQNRFKNATAKERARAMEEELAAMSEELEAQGDSDLEESEEDSAPETKEAVKEAVNEAVNEAEAVNDKESSEAEEIMQEEEPEETDEVAEQEIEECPLTGITLKKFYNSEDSRTEGGYLVDKTEMTIRYGEILLIYAEALNELTSGQVYHLTTYTGADVEIQRNVDEMRYAIKRIRMRAGVPDYSDEIYENPKKFFEKIVHERQIEFFAETQRFYDLRRWKIVEEHESEQIYGCNTLMNEEYKDMYYLPVRVAELQTSFSRKQYFWPISFDELKRNKNLSQAPGWQYYD